MARFTANVDGGARGNPGPAAIGVVLRDADGQIVEAVGETIGSTTNNVAEYRALLRGIELAAAHGATDLELIGDSELVVRQIEGRYKVKNAGMKELHAQAKEALAGLDNWSIRHVKRAQNADADRLVNEALDRAVKA
jgi:ribonuclease HI